MRKCRFIIILIVVSVLALTTLFVACSKKDNDGDVYITLNSEVEVLDKLRVNAPGEKIENAISKGEEINISIEEKGYVYSWYGIDKNNVRREVIGDRGILKLNAIELREVFGTSTINLHPDKYYTKLIIDGDNTP